MAEQLQHRWERFLVSFFGRGNLLNWPSDGAAFHAFVDANVVNLVDDAPGPFVLPRTNVEGATVYYAIANE